MGLESIPSKDFHLNGLDHLRALAIFFVFLFHYQVLFLHPRWVELIGKYGWIGVDLFFVLSGYLISSGLFKEIKAVQDFSWKNFILKRIFKIFPPFLLVLGVYFFFPITHEKESLAPLWKYLSFTQNFGLNAHTQGTFSHAWSLCVEEQFYLFFPFLLYLFLRLKKWKWVPFLLVSIILLGIFVRGYSYLEFCKGLENTDEFGTLWTQYIYYPTYCRLDGLVFGIGLSAIWNFLPKTEARIKRLGNWIGVFTFLVFALVPIFNLENDLSGSLFAFPLIDLSMASLVSIALCPSTWLYKISSSLTRFFSKISYSMYLVHKITIHLVQGPFNFLHLNPNGNAMFLLCLLITVFISFLMYQALEIPFLNWRNKLIYMN